MNTVNDCLKQQIVKILKDKFNNLWAIYLFGSFAKGTSLASSDIDLAILSDSTHDSTYLWYTAQELAVECGRDVDLVDLRSTTTVMRIQIITEGEKLFKVEAADLQTQIEKYENFIFKDYARLNEERREILNDIANRGNVYG